jgi:hypothetical protein
MGMIGSQKSVHDRYRDLTTKRRGSLSRDVWMSYTALEKALKAKHPEAVILFATSNQTSARIQLAADTEPKNYTGDFGHIAQTLNLGTA